MMRNKTTATILCLFLFLTLGFSQKSNRHDEINKKRVEYLISKLDLTVVESQAFWPLYNEYQKKKSALSREIKERFGDYKKTVPNTEEGYRKAVSGMMENKSKQNELITQYNAKYLAILSAEKVFYLYQYEDKFNKSLLRQLKEGGKRNQKNRGNP